MTEFRRILGIDYGRARIGLAVSDELGMMAHPFETVPGRDADLAVARIAEVIEERKIERIVIGLPLLMDGTEGSAVEMVRGFTKVLRPALAEGFEIIEWDERLTTRSAMEKLHAAGRNAKNTKECIDMAAAVEILQEWLNHQEGSHDLPNPFSHEDDEHRR